MTQIPSLNGLRALSVFMVIAAHLSTNETVPSSIAAFLRCFDGAVGVRIFFCISGFLITYLLLLEIRETKTLALGKFYARRALRIIPVCYAFILVLFVLSRMTGLSVSTCQFITALTYTKNYACGTWVDGHLWSLAVEEQFYLLWPLAVAGLSFQRMRQLAIAVILIAPLSRAIEYIDGSRLYAWLPSNADALMIGGLAAMLAIRDPARLERWVKFWPTVFRCLAVAMIAFPAILNRYMILGKFTVTIGPTLQAFGATYLIVSYAFLRAGMAYAILNTSMMSYFGVLSYSLYVWQQLFFTSAETYGVDHSLALDWPTNVVLLLVTVIISYHFLERPLMALRKKLRPVQDQQPV